MLWSIRKKVYRRLGGEGPINELRKGRSTSGLLPCHCKISVNILFLVAGVIETQVGRNEFVSYHVPSSSMSNRRKSAANVK
jgi:hypothetical protein